jgi:hypothetical protein
MRTFLVRLPANSHALTVLAFFVNPDGRVDPCGIEIQSETDSAWTRYVLASLTTLRFNPAIMSGFATRARVTQRFSYTFLH